MNSLNNLINLFQQNFFKILAAVVVIGGIILLLTFLPEILVGVHCVCIICRDSWFCGMQAD